MPKTTRRPSSRCHKATGQAVVTLDGRDFYLGLHGSEANKTEYDRLVAERLANVLVTVDTMDPVARRGQAWLDAEDDALDTFVSLDSVLEHLSEKVTSAGDDTAAKATDILALWTKPKGPWHTKPNLPPKPSHRSLV